MLTDVNAFSKYSYLRYNHLGHEKKDWMLKKAICKNASTAFFGISCILKTIPQSKRDI